MFSNRLTDQSITDGSRVRPDPVEAYYDDNTSLMLRLGQGTDGTIHRAVWGPGVKSRDEAMAYVDALVIQRLRQMAIPNSPRLLDLGCGVCASLCRICREAEATGVGVTISAPQVELALGRISEAGLSDRVQCLRADFCALPSGLTPVDLAYATESFVHAADAEAFFQQCAAAIKPGGQLVICDDMLSGPDVLANPQARYWVGRFRRGWVVRSLLDVSELSQLAARHGFELVEDVDLTDYLELGRPRDLAIAALMRALGWLPVTGSYWSMLYGGHALQVGLQRGYLSYRFTRWRRKTQQEA